MASVDGRRRSGGESDDSSRGSVASSSRKRRMMLTSDEVTKPFTPPPSPYEMHLAQIRMKQDHNLLHTVFTGVSGTAPSNAFSDPRMRGLLDRTAWRGEPFAGSSRDVAFYESHLAEVEAETAARAAKLAAQHKRQSSFRKTAKHCISRIKKAATRDDAMVVADAALRKLLHLHGSALKIAPPAPTAAGGTAGKAPAPARSQAERGVSAKRRGDEKGGMQKKRNIAEG